MMNLIHVWWMGIIRPARAFEELRTKPAPAWGFWVILVFNLLISATTLPALYLLHKTPFLDSWLTFLPNDRYLLAEIFFLPPLRLIVWTIGASVTHLGLRLAHQPSDFDLILNMGGLGYLVTMPFILVSDWLLISLGVYWLAEYTHPISAIWGVILSTIGLKKLMNVSTGLAIGLSLLSMAVSIPLLAIFAR